MEYFVSALWIGLEILCVLIFCSTFLNRKQTNTKAFLGVLLVWLLIFAYSNTGINGMLKPLISLTVLTFLSLWIFTGKALLHLLLVSLCYIFITITDTLIVNGACILLDISYLDLVWKKITYVTITTIDKLVAVLITWIIYHIFSTSGLLKTNSKWLALMILFPITSIAMFAMLVYNSNRSRDLPISVVIFSGILTIANVALLYIITSLEKATKQAKETSMLKQQIALQAENYTALKENYSSQRKATHEFKRHIQTLYDLLDQNEFKTAKQYVFQLQNNRTLDIFSISTKHPVFDVILNQKYQIAQEHHIHMQIQVNDLSRVPLQTDTIVVLLSNLLDNAIEACQRMENRSEIYCRIIMDGDLNIVIRNTSPEVEIIDGSIKTSKANLAEHGYGLPAVKYILDELGGEYTFDYHAGWFTFVAEITFE